MFWKNYIHARNFLFRISKHYFYSVFSCKRQLWLYMFSCACIFGFLHHNHLLVIHFLCYGKCRSKRSVSCRASFQPLQLSQCFSHVKHFALLYSHISVHVPQRPCRRSRDIGPVGPCCKWNSKSCVSRCERLFIELPVAGQGKASKINTGGNYFCISGAGFYDSPCCPCQISSSGISAYYAVRFFSIPFPALHNQFMPKCLNPCYSKWCIKRGIEISCFLQKP